MSPALDPDALLAEADRRQIGGDIAGAIELYDAVLAGNPTMWTAQANRGLALAITGDHSAACAAFRRALALAPAAATVLRNLADSLLRSPEVEPALALAAGALLAVASDRPESWLVSGRSWLRFDRQPEARRALARSLALAPAEPDTLAALNDADTPADKARWLRRLVSLIENEATLLALARREAALGNSRRAIRASRRALALDPGQLAPLVEMTGVIDGYAASFEVARWCRRALLLAPDSAVAWNNLGTAELGLGHLDRAERAFSNAIAQIPDFAEAHFNRATPLFLIGREEEAWAEYDWRWRIARFERPPTQASRWMGDPLRGRALLVHDEQGMGDALHFSRFLPLIDKDGGSVVFACDARLVRLVEGSLPGIRVVPRSALPAHDLSVPLLSLPRILGSAGARPPYLLATDPAILDAGGRHRIGLVWSGNPSHPRDRERSIPLNAFAPLLARPNIAWISLQIGPARDDIRRGGLERVLPDLGVRVADLLDTARIVAGLDLLITVDTAIAHLAGALDRPVWTMVTRVPDWRWGMTGAATAWYPSMRLFRQPEPGDWRTVINDLAGALDALPAIQP